MDRELIRQMVFGIWLDVSRLFFSALNHLSVACISQVFGDGI